MSAADHFGVYGAGSIVLLFPRTLAASQWIAENLPADAMRFGHSIAIEARYWPPIGAAIIAEFGEPGSD